MPRYLVAHSDGQTDAAPLLGAFWERLSSTADVMLTAFDRNACIEWRIVEARGAVSATADRSYRAIHHRSADHRDTVQADNLDDSVAFMRAIAAARRLHTDDGDE